MPLQTQTATRTRRGGTTTWGSEARSWLWAHCGSARHRHRHKHTYTGADTQRASLHRTCSHCRPVKRVPVVTCTHRAASAASTAVLHKTGSRQTATQVFPGPKHQPEGQKQKKKMRWKSGGVSSFRGAIAQPNLVSLCKAHMQAATTPGYVAKVCLPSSMVHQNNRYGCLPSIFRSEALLAHRVMSMFPSRGNERDVALLSNHRERERV